MLRRRLLIVFAALAVVAASVGPASAAPGPVPGEPGSEISTFATGFTSGYGIAVDADGNTFVTDPFDIVVKKITPEGVISIVAGNGSFGSAGDGGQATSAELAGPRGLAVDDMGNLYIAEASGDRIRRVAADGVISTFAGTGDAGFSGDGGPATAAELDFPHDVEIDSVGNVYISSFSNDRIRMVAPNGIISTFAGTGVSGFSGDGGPATAAQLSAPRTMTIDADDNLFVFEWGNTRVRRISSDGTITTVAGDGGFGTDGDGGLAIDASLQDTKGLAVDDAGNLYISDESTDVVRRVDTDGMIETVAGTGVAGYSGDGGPPLDAQFNFPRGLALRPDGTLLVVDVNHVRAITAGSPPVVTIDAPTTVQRFGPRSTVTFECVHASLASCTATANGAPIVSGAAIPTSTNGVVTIVVTGVDDDGNTSSQTASVVIDWTIDGTYAAVSGNAGTVVRFYVATFGRLPETEGFEFWTALLDDDPSALIPVSAFFTTSPEFESLYGETVTDEQFVTTIYTNVLGRPPEQAGRDFWAGAIADGSHTRASVMSFFAQSPEHKQLTGTS